MDFLFAQLARFLTQASPAAVEAEVATVLMERAEDRGQSAFETQQLRRAAYAYLSVVR